MGNALKFTFSGSISVDVSFNGFQLVSSI